MSQKFRRRAFSALAVGLVLSLSVAGAADARRGGSFGSRGMRTYQAPRSTFTAPQAVGPIQRSMTPPGYAGPNNAGPNYQPGFQRPGGFGYQPQGGFLQRWGGPIMGGLLGAGLFGMLSGHGFGGYGGGFGGGFLALIVQIAVIALLASLAMRFFRRRQDAYAPPFASQPQPFAMQGPSPVFQPPPVQPTPHAQWTSDEVGLNQADFDAFEKLLVEVQGAFGREDYDTLRTLATPEVMSYLAEELAQNAAAGRRNEVRDVRLVSGDLSEAWSEGGADYATVAMRYSSVEMMRDRADGRVVSGAETPSETTEIWTFVRERSSPWGSGTWKLSAIQET